MLLLGDYGRDRRSTLLYLGTDLGAVETIIDYEVAQLRSGEGAVYLMGFEYVNSYRADRSFLKQEPAGTPKALAVTRRGVYLADGAELRELGRHEASRFHSSDTAAASD